MRKSIFLPAIAILGIFLFWNFFYNSKKIIIATEQSAQVKAVTDNEDGILLAQQQEFEMTKDISLGYIPKQRLINAYEDLMAQRNQRTGFTNATEALTWAERGPNSDVVGPSNGNGRPGGGIPSGRVRAIWVDLTDVSNHTVWVGGIDGGLWKTTNINASPATWTLVNDFFGNLAIGSICQDPLTPATMYFGTGEKTVNFDAVRGGGVWKSTNSGATWSLLPSTTGFWNVSKILCDAAGNVYVATIGNNSGIQRSTDGGTSWTNILPTGLVTQVPEMEISSTGRLHVVCGYDGTPVGSSGYRFTDIPATVTSATWTSATTSFSPVQYNVDLAVAGTTLYALPADASFQTPAVWTSTDGGANWATTTTSPTTGGMTPLSSGQAWYNLDIAVDPVTTNNVIVGGLNGYRTTNGGTTWSPNAVWVTGVPGSTNYIHADHQVAVWNGNQVLVGSDGGIFYSADGGATFADRNVGLRIKQFYSCAIHPTSTNYFLAGAQDNGNHQFTNAGLSSTTEITGGDGAFVHIDQDEPQYQWGAYVFSQYFRSVDGGANWFSINYSNSIGQFINITDYDDINNKMYTSGIAGQYIRWDDGPTGATFTPIAIGAFGPNTARSITVSPYTSNRVFFGTAGGRVVRVDNANQASPTATAITGGSMSASTVSCIAVGTTDNNLIATFSNYGSIHVWVSSDGGTSWTNISGNLPDIPVRWAMFYPEDNTKAILATEMGVYETNLINAGATVWAQDPTFPVSRTDMLQYRKADGTVAAATHGRGLWTSTVPFTIPYVRFEAPYTTQTETTTSTTGCRNYKDYTVNMNIDMSPTGNANVTLSLAGGGTATQGVDFDFTTNGNFAAPSTVLTFPNGSSAPQPFTIRIYNDAAVESPESFTLNYSIGGGTNAQSAPSSLSYTFYIVDNDTAPLVLTTATVGTNNTTLTQPFRGQFSDSKTRTVYLASELTGAGFSAGLISSIGLNVTSKASSAPYNNLTIKMKNSPTTTVIGGGAFETSITTVYGPTNYSTVAGVNTFNLTTPFFWDGTSNLIIEFCYDNVSGTATDNVSGTSGLQRCDLDRQNASSGCAMTVANFSSASRPVVTFTVGSSVESVLNNNRTEHIGDNGSYYFYTSATSNIINSLASASASLGCVTSNIFETGTTWQAFSGGQRSQKVIDIAPTTNPGATSTVGLYFTLAELGGKAPASLRMAKTTAATMAAANSGNTTTATTSFAAFGTGYVFTASFTGFGKFFLIDAAVPLPVTLLSFDGRLNNNSILLNWSTSSELNSNYFNLEKSSDGTNFYSIGTVNAAGTSTIQRNYNFTDRQVNEFNYYRLKMVDIDGHFIYSKTVLIKNPDAKQNVWVVNNPFRTFIQVRFAKTPQQKVQFDLVNMAGVTVYRKETGSSNEIRLDLSTVYLPAGMYMLRTRVDGRLFTHKLAKD